MLTFLITLAIIFAISIITFISLEIYDAFLYQKIYSSKEYEKKIRPSFIVKIVVGIIAIITLVIMIPIIIILFG